MGFYGAGQSINNTSFFNPSMLSNPMMNMLTSPLGPNLMGVNGGLPPHIPTPRLPNPALPASHSLPGMYYIIWIIHIFVYCIVKIQEQLHERNRLQK